MDKPQSGDIVEVQIEDIGFEGNGIGRINSDFVLFIPNTVPGDIIKAKIRKVKKKFALAKTEEILVNSPVRTKPECSHFGSCNGCKLQNIDYYHQLNIKKRNVTSSFEKIGVFQGLTIPDVIGSDNIYYYRNKLEFSFSNNKWLSEEDFGKNTGNSFALGYHMPGFIDKVLDIEKCHLQSEISNRILNLTRDFFKTKKESIYSTKTSSGYLRYVIIRQSANINDAMVNLITLQEKKEIINKYAQKIKNEIPEITTLVNSISTSKAQVAKSEYSIIIFGKGYIEETIGKYKFKITPSSFFQTNTKQCEKLFNTVVEFADFSKNENVLDLYCGCGAISLYISGYVNKVFGVELSEESIKIAKENSSLNNINNCEFTSYDVKEFLKNLINKNEEKYDTIILDPPRSGIHPKSAEYLLRYEPKKIIYVSCNPTTQARDIKLLSEKYEITKIQPVDMFPHTFHIENVVRLDLKN
ncbi:MAG: 23S rRNA (uracil(1939)-C(5))-methyltransferase RlmD [Chlorobi bacterium]|nr:23S rRNA (uracil(1939)-C(5))-methyltransferase RlmD [Chlorobiota bacterium]MCI0715898.1 23S rRNA (uracil(1939)-C(5))-methyltransferase RlmD [Chlorobiota bacterium]